MICIRNSAVGLLYRRCHYLQNKMKNIQEKEMNTTYLCKCLGITETKARYLVIKNPVITKLTEERIKSLIETLRELRFTKEVLIKEPALFSVQPLTLKFRYKVLEECGIAHISSEILVTYLTILKQKLIGELKESCKIPAYVNIENRLAGYMTQWPTSLTTLIYEDVNNSTLFTLRLKIIQRYLELVLDLSQEEFYRGIATYPTVKHRPLEYINETLKILQSQITIPNHKIKSNLYLLQADPENLKNILQNIRYIGGIDIKEVIRMHPKLAVRNCQTLLEIRNILEQYNINNEAQRRCFDIYTLGIETIKERLENAKSLPEFNMFFNHPRFLRMIHYKQKATKRLCKLYESNKKCLSLNILSGSKAHYEVFERAPGDRLGKGKDLLFCISQSLGRKFKVTKIGKIIRRHPFWMNIPVLQVKYVYEQLSSQFSDEELYENCLILLYPWKKVRETLNMLNQKQLYEELPMCHENLNYDCLNNSQKLSLILYILEKSHYFSGNGVWAEERKYISDKMQVKNSKI